MNNVKKIAGEFHLPLNNNLEKFKRFRDLYLAGFNFKVIACPNINKNEDITDYVFDNIFMDNYVTNNGLNSQLMVYMWKVNKFEGFPTIHYISVEDSIDRRNNLKEQLINSGIKSKPCVFKRYEEGDCNLIGINVNRLNISSKGVVTSHLKALKEWYNTSSEDLIFVCEDDFSLEMANYWNFTWKDFMNNLPSDWECVQLVQLREYITEFKLKERNFFDWSTCGYIMKREYVKKLLDKRHPDNNFHLHTESILPIAENILFCSIGQVYSIPLFSEECMKVDTSSVEPVSDAVATYYRNIHINSYNSVLNWWKTQGKNTSIKDLLEIPATSFSWGLNPVEYNALYEKEIFINKTYERFNSVKEGDVVMDIGANVGAFTYTILDRNPKHIYCIEPSKDLFPTLVKNTNRGNTTCINKAVAEIDSDNIPVTPSVHIALPKDNYYEGITFKKIIQDYNIEKIDFMKIDCEGGEYYVFTEENYEYIMNNVKSVAGEWHL